MFCFVYHMDLINGLTPTVKKGPAHSFQPKLSPADLLSCLAWASNVGSFSIAGSSAHRIGPMCWDDLVVKIQETYDIPS